MSTITITTEQSEKWVTTARILKQAGELLPKLLAEIAAANHVDDCTFDKATEEDIRERVALRSALVRLTLKAGYSKKSAGPFVARMMIDQGYRIRAERSDNAGVRSKRDTVIFAKLDKVARQFVFENLLTESSKVNTENMTAGFWDSLATIARLGKAGELPSNRKAWSL